MLLHHYAGNSQHSHHGLWIHAEAITKDVHSAVQHVALYVLHCVTTSRGTHSPQLLPLVQVQTCSAASVVAPVNDITSTPRLDSCICTTGLLLADSALADIALVAHIAAHTCRAGHSTYTEDGSLALTQTLFSGVTPTDCSSDGT